MSAVNGLENVSFCFSEICKIAKDLAPNYWCIVASNQRLSFIDIHLPQVGPATIQKQLILNNYMQLEAYVGTRRIKDEILALNDVKSVEQLQECVHTFDSFQPCQGNRNFHRSSSNAAETKVEYWKHTNCLMLYEKGCRKEQCCDSCLTLNSFLTKKQRKNAIPYGEDFVEAKKIKVIDTEEIIIKNEMM